MAAGLTELVRTVKEPLTVIAFMPNHKALGNLIS